MAMSSSRSSGVFIPAKPSTRARPGIMLRRLIIHAGMPRAGSSSLQEALFHSRVALEAEGLLYPVLGLEHAAASELAQVYNHKLLFQSARGLWPTKSFRPLHAEIAGQIAASPAECVMLSYEGWWDPRSHRRLKRTLRVLQKAVPGLTPEIAVVVREPVAFIVSLYKLDVLHGRAAENFEAYWPEKLNDSRLGYSTIGDSLSQFAGTQHVIGFDAAAADGELAGHVLKMLGLGKVLEAPGLAQVARHRSTGGAYFSDAVVSMVLYAAREHGLRLIGRHRRQLLPAFLKLAQSPEHAADCARLVIPVSAASAAAIAQAAAEEANPYFTRHFGHPPKPYPHCNDKPQSAITDNSSLAQAILTASKVLNG